MNHKRNIPLLLGNLLVLVGCTATPKARYASKPKTPPAPPLNPERYTLSEETTTVVTHIRAFITHRIWFTKMVGEFLFDPNNWERSVARVQVATASATARIGVVARVARSRFLHVWRFPSAGFTTLKLTPTADRHRFTATGELEVHGVRKIIRVPVTVSASACWLAFRSEFTVNRRDFDVVASGALDFMVDDDMAVVVRIKLPRKGRPTTCG